MTVWPDHTDAEYVNVKYVHVAVIESNLRTLVLQHLRPNTIYIAYMTAVNDLGESNKTENITFTTYSGE